MSDHSYITPTKERQEVPLVADESNFPVIQGDRYKFEKVIGSGGAGTVYKAHDTVLNKPVAIKKLHASSSGDMAIRFQREARLIAALRHNNVMSAMDFGLTPKNEPYLILDYVDGESLSHLLRREGALPLQRALPLFLQLCCGLAHAHKNNIIHRDIKPSNVMLVEEVDAQSSSVQTVAKVVDFGLAKDIQHDQNLTRTNVTLGTPLYMSPEQTRGVEVDSRSDIYSFGVLMFESLTGEPPFEGDTPVELAEMHRNEQSPTLESYGVTCSAELESIVAKCLNKNPNDRFQSFDVLHSMLQRELDSIASQIAENKYDKKLVDIPVAARSNDSKTTLFVVGGCVLGALIIVTGALALSSALSEKVPMEKVRVVDALNDTFTMNDGKVMPGGKGGLRDAEHKLSSDGRWIFIDAKDSDVRKILKSKQLVKDVDISDATLGTSTFELLGQRKTLESVIYTTHPIDETNLRKIALLKPIKHLQIGFTTTVDVNALNHIKELPDLRQLAIEGVTLTDEVFATIATFQNLDAVDLSHCKGVSPKGMKLLTQMKKLTQIRVDYSDITDDGIKAVSGMNLENLFLSSNPNLTDKTIESLMQMKSLSELDVTNNKKITEVALQKLRSKSGDTIHVYSGESYRLKTIQDSIKL